MLRATVSPTTMELQNLNMNSAGPSEAAAPTSAMPSEAASETSSEPAPPS